MFSNLNAAPETSCSRQIKSPLPRKKLGGTWSPHPDLPATPAPLWEACWRSPRPCEHCLRNTSRELLVRGMGSETGRERGKTTQENLRLFCVTPALLADPPNVVW